MFCKSILEVILKTSACLRMFVVFQRKGKQFQTKLSHGAPVLPGGVCVVFVLCVCVKGQVEAKLGRGSIY